MSAPSNLDQFHRYETGAKAARDAGDMEAADYLRQQARGFLSKHYSAESDASGELDPTTGTSTAEKFMTGMGQGIYDVGRHAANLVGQESDAALQSAKERDTPLLDTTAGSLGSMAGQTGTMALAMAPLAAMAPEAGAAGAVARLASNPLVRAGVEGATQGAVMTDPGQSRLGNAVLGAGLGAALPAVGAVGGKMLRGLSRTPEAQKLIDAGVYPTIGQLKPGGIMSTLEQAPGIKQTMNVLGVRQNVKDEYLRALAQEASPPGTVIRQSGARQMLDDAYQSFQPLYDAGKGFPVAATVHGLTSSRPIGSALSNSLARVPGISKEAAQSAQDFVNKNLNIVLRDARLSGKGLQSEQLLELRSAVRAEARDYAATTGVQARQYERAYDTANDTITKALRSHLPGDAMDAVDLADQHYSQYKMLEDAMKKADKAGRADLGPTPYELTSSISSGTSALGKNRAARGVGISRLKDLADAGKATFEENPEMRTGHSVGTLGAMMGLAGAASYPLALGATILGSGSRVARRIAAGENPLQQALRGAGNRAASRISPTTLRRLGDARALLSQLGQRGSVAALTGPTGDSVADAAATRPWVPDMMVPGTAQ